MINAPEKQLKEEKLTNLEWKSKELQTELKSKNKFPIK